MISIGWTIYKCWDPLILSVDEIYSLSHLLLHLKMHLWMIFKIFTSELFNWHLARYQFETFYSCITGSMIFHTNKVDLFDFDIYHFFSDRNFSPSWIFKKESWRALFTKILTQLSLIKNYLFIVVHFNPLYIEGWLFHFPAFIITQL